MPTENELTQAHEAVAQADDAARAARAARDRLIRQAIADGMTAYRIAQILGIQQSAVAKIRHASD